VKSNVAEIDVRSAYEPSYALFSRDARTQNLFRRSWLAAIESVGGTANSVCRGFGIFAQIRYVYRFRRQPNSRRLIFGTSEILMLIWFANANDILVFTGLGRLLQGEGWRSNLVRLFLRLSYRRQTVVALNPDDQRYLSILFSNGATLIKGEGYRFSQNSFVLRPRRPIRIGYVGRLLKSKGVDRLIETTVKLDRCQLTLIGDADFGNSDAIGSKWLEQQIAISDGKLQHLGFVADVRAALHDVDIVVSMSTREGLPFGILDAIDSGCLAVLSPVPGHRSFEGLEGVIFTDPDKLHEVLQRVISTPEDYFDFDPLRRKCSCSAEFGFDSVTVAIANMLQETSVDPSAMP
jgi:glycosyltransferase involved in cell wall biosynthesis